MKAESTIEYKGHVIEIVHDEDAEGPADYGDDNLFLIAAHRQCWIPPSKDERNFDVNEVIDRFKRTHWVLMLEAYIHSGVVLALSGCGNFPDRCWDVSQLGAVFVSKKEWRLSKSARKAALSLIETWNQYLSGDVWGYVIDDDDSCWGFYGYDYCVKEAKSVVDSMQKRALVAAK